MTKPDEVPQINLSLDDYEDTISFYWSDKTFFFNLETGNLKVISASYICDDQQSEIPLSSGKLSFSLHFNNPRLYRLTLKIITNSGTNSIADKMGAEGYLFESKTFLLYVKEHPFDVLSAQPNKTGLSLSWKPFNGSDFYCYRLQSKYSHFSVDLLKNTYNYESYIGEYDEYTVYVIDKQKNEHPWGYVYLYQSNFPELNVKYKNDHYELSWSSSIYKDKIREIQIYKWVDYKRSLLATLPVEDTLYQVSNDYKTFGEKASFCIRYIPKIEINDVDLAGVFENETSTEVILATPTAVKEYIFPYASNCNSLIYSTTPWADSSYKYSFADNKIQKLMNFENDQSACFSPKGKYATDVSNNNINLYDLELNTKIKSINISTIADSKWLNDKVHISDNGIGVFINSNNLLVVYDFLNERLIDSLNNMSAYKLLVSSSGQYFSADSSGYCRLYKVESSSITRLGKVSPISFSISMLYNFLEEKQEFYITDKKTYIYVYSLETLKKIRKIQLNPNEEILDFDDCSGKFLSRKSCSEIKIYDYSTGALSQSLLSYLTCDAHLYNNTLYSRGYMFHLNK